jgi:hypothetical protein
MNLLPRTLISFAALVGMLAACSDNETPPLPEDHTPTSYSILVNEVPATAPYTFSSGQTDRVRIKFFNAAQEDLDDVESGHFGGLSFSPVSRASAVRLSDHHYQFDVTGGTPGSGTLQVGFGHNEQANEVTFEPVPITVSP